MSLPTDTIEVLDDTDTCLQSQANMLSDTEYAERHSPTPAMSLEHVCSATELSEQELEEQDAEPSQSSPGTPTRLRQVELLDDSYPLYLMPGSYMGFEAQPDLPQGPSPRRESQSLEPLAESGEPAQAWSPDQSLTQSLSESALRPGALSMSQGAAIATSQSQPCTPPTGVSNGAPPSPGNGIHGKSMTVVKLAASPATVSAALTAAPSDARALATMPQPAFVLANARKRALENPTCVDSEGLRRVMNTLRQSGPVTPKLETAQRLNTLPEPRVFPTAFTVPQGFVKLDLSTDIGFVLANPPEGLAAFCWSSSHRAWCPARIMGWESHKPNWATWCELAFFRSGRWHCKHAQLFSQVLCLITPIAAATHAVLPGLYGMAMGSVVAASPHVIASPTRRRMTLAAGPEAASQQGSAP